MHLLDQTGAFLAIVYISIVLLFGLPVKYALLGTMIPLAISTLLIATTKTARVERRGNTNVKVVVTITLSTLFFGFTFFSFGFPVISVAQLTHKEYLGTLAFAIFSGTSALSAFFYGRSKVGEIKGLAFLGYATAAIASFGFALTYDVSLTLLYVFSALMGIAVGAIETFEPSIISKFTSSDKVATGMGTLSLGRALGISIGNLVMGFLYVVSPFYSYSFAAVMTLIASAIVLTVRR
ncbi:MFS transporter [Sulfuracidifex tepidarius]|nr:MFS transporter [Sulfuracidifex tepidarius]